MPKYKLHKTMNGEEHKYCRKCVRWKALSNFCKDKTRKDGFCHYCKICLSAYRCKNKERINAKKRERYQKNKKKILNRAREYREKNKEKISEMQREYRENNKDRLRKKKRQYYLENKERITERSQKYRETNRNQINEKALQYYRENKKKILHRAREYREKNKEKYRKRERAWREKNIDRVKELRAAYEKRNRKKINKRERERRNNNPSARINLNLRNRLMQSLRRARLKKENNTFEYISCSPSFLLERLERQRIERGLDASAHVDHMMPLHSFDLSDPEQMRRAWHWSNLSLLSREDNLRKGSKVIYDMTWCLKTDQWLIRNKDGRGPYRPTALFQSLLSVS